MARGEVSARNHGISIAFLGLYGGMRRKLTSSENDDLGSTTVQGLGGFVGALLQLAVVRGLLDEVEDRLRESLVGDGPGCKSTVLASFQTTLKFKRHRECAFVSHRIADRKKKLTSSRLSGHLDSGRKNKILEFEKICSCLGQKVPCRCNGSPFAEKKKK